MDTKQLLAHMRNVLQDERTPPMWSNDTLITYWNEGKSRFAMDTHYFVRKNVELEIDELDDTYELPLDTHFIYSVRVDDRHLAQSSVMQLAQPRRVGEVECYILDAEPGYITFAPSPNRGQIAHLVMAGEPADLSVNDLSGEVDLPKQFILAPCEWVYYRCYSHNDADGANAQASEMALKRYQRFVAEMKVKLFRRNNGPLPMARGFKY